MNLNESTTRFIDRARELYEGVRHPQGDDEDVQVAWADLELFVAQLCEEQDAYYAWEHPLTIDLAVRATLAMVGYEVMERNATV